jgi:hypothetical protein
MKIDNLKLVNDDKTKVSEKEILKLTENVWIEMKQDVDVDSFVIRLFTRLFDTVCSDTLDVDISVKGCSVYINIDEGELCMSYLIIRYLDGFKITLASIDDIPFLNSWDFPLIYELSLTDVVKKNNPKESHNEILSLQLFGNVLFRDYEYIEELFREIDYRPDFSYAIKMRQSIYTIYAKYSPLLYVDYQRGSTNRLCVKFGDVEIIYYIEFDTSNSVLKITPFSIKSITDNYLIIKELCVKINKNN